jgi:hypothetical protein
MAILYKKDLGNGYEATYLRVLSSPSFQFQSGQAELWVEWYKDAETRFAGKNPITAQNVFIQLDDQAKKVILAEVYRLLKTIYPGVDRDPDPERSVKDETENIGTK